MDAKLCFLEHSRKREHLTDYIVAIDQGTTSTRSIVFNREGEIVSTGQLEHKQIMTNPGWVEHDPQEIWDNTREVIGQALSRANLTRHQIAAIGITNQRETTVVWDRFTGKPVYNAIVWQDTRTQPIVDRLSQGNPDKHKHLTGLPLAPYFSASKIIWILEKVEGVRERAEKGDLLFGTTDSWLLWNLTGGVNGGVHKTDVTNASRTLMMNLETLDWDQDILKEFDIPASMLPKIQPSVSEFGTVESNNLLREVKVTGILGDQQAATFGQTAFNKGESKNTYGTGNFLIVNTGNDIVQSKNGLITTVCYQIEGDKPVYALEGSIAVTGSLVQWLRDNLGIIKESAEVEELAKTVKDNGGAYLVPAFSGLFAPHWRSDARGVLVGLTRFVNKGHIARASLEATAFQTAEVMEAAKNDAGLSFKELRVDGGMVKNETLMQFQADILNMPVIRPKVIETTALGVAYAAGLQVGYWENLQQLREIWQEGARWEPNMSETDREQLTLGWDKAVQRTLDWA